MTAIITLGRLRYRAASARNATADAAPPQSPAGRIILKSDDESDSEDKVFFDALAHSAPDARAPRLDHEGFLFNDEITLALYLNGNSAAVGLLTIAEDDQDDDGDPETWDYVTFEGEHGAYTLSFHVERMAEDDASPPTETSGGATSIQLEEGAGNAVTPNESVLVFFPKHNRRNLRFKDTDRFGRDNLSADDPWREAFKEAIDAEASRGPDDDDELGERRSPWIRRFIGLKRNADGSIWTDRRGRRKRQYSNYYPISIGGETREMHVKDPADMTGAFTTGVRKFTQYWGLDAATAVYEIDNGIETGSAFRLGYGHAGEGDAHTQSERRNYSAGETSDGIPDSPDRLFAILDKKFEEGVRDISAIVFFCHGWRHGLQLGFKEIHGVRGRAHLAQFAEKINRISRDDVVVILYSCATAKPNPRTGEHDGTEFAGLLRDEILSQPNPSTACRVVGHMKTAHSYWMPYIMFYEGRDGVGSPGIDLTPGGPPATNPMRANFQTYLRGDFAHDHDGFRWEYPFMTVTAIQNYLIMDNPPIGGFDEPWGQPEREERRRRDAAQRERDQRRAAREAEIERRRAARRQARADRLAARQAERDEARARRAARRAARNE